MKKRRYYELGVKLQKKDVWRLTRKKRERLNGIYDVGGKLLNGIKSIYVHSLDCLSKMG